MDYKEVWGNLITLAKEGAFDVIAHGCNCFCTMGSGLAPQMARAFGCDEFYYEGPQYKGTINKLGIIDYGSTFVNPKTGHIKTYTTPFNDPLLEAAGYKHVSVVNCYSQYGYDVSTKPLNYTALKLCFQKMNHIFKGKHIGLPEIGCHLAGGEWGRVEAMIKDAFTNCPVTVVHYRP